MRHSRRQRGFTAIEITMVATIIAIIALLILPLFRNRTEEAKRIAALDDLQSLAKAAMLVNADTDQYPRLQDLDNTQNFTAGGGNPDLDVPIAVWNRPLSDSERLAFQSPGRWQGPYSAVQRAILLGDLRATNANILRAYTTGVAAGGAILYVQSPGSLPSGQPYSLADPDSDRIPIDPWGSPYLFFGPGSLGPTSGVTESQFGNSVIYSLGPDGLPGLGQAATPDNYTRERLTQFNVDPALTDDLQFVF